MRKGDWTKDTIPERMSHYWLVADVGHPRIHSRPNEEEDYIITWSPIGAPNVSA